MSECFLDAAAASRLRQAEWHKRHAETEAKAAAKKAKRKKRRNAGKKRRSPSASFLRSAQWKRARYKALKAADGRCQCCGRGPSEGGALNVDHIKPRNRYPELALDLNNLQVLCGSCNAGKGNWDETDWREPRLSALMGERVA